MIIQSVLQEGIRTSLSKIFRGNYTDVQAVLRAEAHLASIYICHGSCRFLHCQASLKQELKAFQDWGLIPPSTVRFYESHSAAIDCCLPPPSSFFAPPEQLYGTIQSGELHISKTSVLFHPSTISRDMVGAYYTPPEFAFQITRHALDLYIERRTGIRDLSRLKVSEDQLRAAENAFSGATILDYACGCGEFLLAAVRYFEQYLPQYPKQRLLIQLRGIDVDPIACMVAAVRCVSGCGQTDAKVISGHFMVANTLLADEGGDLETRFDLFAQNRFYAPGNGLAPEHLPSGSCIVLGNPPWEKLRFEERAFFRRFMPEIAEIPQKDVRRKHINLLSVSWPELYDYYTLLKGDYASLKERLKRSDRFRHSLVGERNTYALFAELAADLSVKDGISAIVVKSSLVTSSCYAPLFCAFLDQKLLYEVFLYSNQDRLFPIDSREQFCIAFFQPRASDEFRVHCGLRHVSAVSDSPSIMVTGGQLRKINPATGLLPNLSEPDCFEFLIHASTKFPAFSEVFTSCHFGRLIHLTAHADQIFSQPGEDRVPIYEGKFLEQYDNRYSTFSGVSPEVRSRAKAAAKKQPGDPFQVEKPFPESRFFVERTLWNSFLKRYDRRYSLCWRSLTSATNQRTMLASVLPTMPTCQSIQLLQTSDEREMLLILGLFNSKVFDYIIRLKLSGIDLTQTVVRQIPVPPRPRWEIELPLWGGEYRASDAILMLEKALYRNEPKLDALWDGVQDIPDLDTRYTSSAGLREELDRIFFVLYGLSEEEKHIVLTSFTR